MYFPTTSNVNDTEMKQNEASILAFFVYPSETNLAFSKILEDQSEAKSAYLRTLKDQKDRREVTSAYTRNKKDQSEAKSGYSI
jgi:hypothetical protein